jgi:hypothetical protein
MVAPITSPTSFLLPTWALAQGINIAYANRGATTAFLFIINFGGPRNTSFVTFLDGSNLNIQGSNLKMESTAD